MKLNKLKESLNALTPQQKIEILKTLPKKDKEVQQLLLRAKEEQRIFEENLRNELRTQQETEEQQQQEQPLEQLIEEEQEAHKTSMKEQTKPIYGVENIKYLSSPEADKEYHKGIDLQTNQRGNLLSTEERLKKERKKYETGTA